MCPRSPATSPLASRSQTPTFAQNFLQVRYMICPSRFRPLWAQSCWALSVFYNFFNNKKDLFVFFIKLIWLGVGFLNRTGGEIGYYLHKKNNKNHFLLLKNKKNTESAQLCGFSPANILLRTTTCFLNQNDSAKIEFELFPMKPKRLWEERTQLDLIRTLELTLLKERVRCDLRDLKNRLMNHTTVSKDCFVSDDVTTIETFKIAFPSRFFTRSHLYLYPILNGETLLKIYI